MPDLRFLLKVSRPRFWFYTFGPYLLGLIAAISSPSDLVNIAYFALGIFFLYPANLMVYGINDIFDYETDRVNPKKSGYENLVEYDSHPEIWIAIALTSVGFVGELFFSNPAATLAAATFIFLSVFYSAPPIRAKTKPFLDSGFNILYVMPGVYSYAWVTSEFPPVEIIVAGGLWAAAMHAFSAVPDIEADKTAGISTVATVCGVNGTIALCLVLYAASAILSAPFLGFASLTLGSAYVILMLAAFVSARNGRLFKLYKAFPLINIAAGFVLFLTIALSKA